MGFPLLLQAKLFFFTLLNNFIFFMFPMGIVWAK